MNVQQELVFSIFVYNIIFGSGALLLPKIFWEVGYLFGSAFLLFLASISYVSCVFVVESLSLTNLKYKMLQNSNSSSTTKRTASENEEIIGENNLHDGNNQQETHLEEFISNDDNTNLIRIEKKFELAEMANFFFGRGMLILFYTLIILYLYGDLCIYLSIVGTTLTGLSCPTNSTKLSMMSDVCNNIGAENIFRILVTLFFVTTATFVFMNLKKSVFVQIITMFLRLTAVIIMVTLASIRISNKAQYDIKPFRLQGLPKFFGVCLYSFMCQHSLPSMINYVQNKKARFNYWILLSMGIALCFYLVTLVTATLAFTGDELYNVYSMNFDKEGDTIFVKVLYYYLMIFPTIALSGSYPIVGITLRENLISFSNILLGRDINESLRKWIYPILAILPSYIIVMILPDRVSVLAGYVGAYAGSFVQYFIPACLVLWGRRTIMREFPNVNLSQNTHSFKIFRNMLAPIILIGWTFIGIGIVTYYYITK